MLSGRREAGWDATALTFTNLSSFGVSRLTSQYESFSPADSVTAEIGRSEAKVLGDLP